MGPIAAHLHEGGVLCLGRSRGHEEHHSALAALLLPLFSIPNCLQVHVNLPFIILLILGCAPLSWVNAILSMGDFNGFFKVACMLGTWQDLRLQSLAHMLLLDED